MPEGGESFKFWTSSHPDLLVAATAARPPAMLTGVAAVMGKPLCSTQWLRAARQLSCQVIKFKVIKMTMTACRMHLTSVTWFVWSELWSVSVEVVTHAVLFSA